MMGSKPIAPSIATEKQMFWSLTDGLDSFHLGQAGAYAGHWQAKNALYLDSLGKAVLCKEVIRYRSYRLEAEVALPGQAGFIGLVFGARDEYNYELVYMGSEEIQYDPIMNGSMTWQIYNGPRYQKPLPNTTRKWMKLALEIHPNGVRVFLNDAEEPQLVIAQLQHGRVEGGIGFWSYLPACIRNFAVAEIPYDGMERSSADYSRLKSEGFITEWLVSQGNSSGEQEPAGNEWLPVLVEENGTLNMNRLYEPAAGASGIAAGLVELEEGSDGILSFGFSDVLRLWFNDELVYEGDWCWKPPTADGRIRSSYESVPVRGKAGVNRIRAELTNFEMFGWGLAVKADFTGL
jgi:hypothetical protein